MGDIRPNGTIIPVKSNDDVETSDANEDNFNESNINDSIKALENEFDVINKTPKIETIGEPKK